MLIKHRQYLLLCLALPGTAGTLIFPLPARAVELMKWERIPLQVPLTTGHERIVFVNRNVRVGFPPELNNKLRVQSTGALCTFWRILTTPYVFSPEDAVAMTEAGADIIVVHLGLTTGGDIGADTAHDLESCIPVINMCAAAAKAVRDDVIVLCHGGPIAEPEDASFILSRCPGCHGFYGASSMEHLPTELAIKNTVAAFKKIKAH